MARYFLLYSLISLFLIGCGAVPGKILIGADEPTMRFYRLEDGSELTLQSYPDKRKVIVFWNTHCSASKRALRSIDQFASHPANQIDTVYIAANLDDSEELDKVKDTIKELNIYNVENMMSGNNAYDQAFQKVLGDRVPYIVVISADGKIVDIDSDRDIVVNTKRLR